MATLYFNGAVNNNWATLGNWWQNAAFTTPATALPTTADDVILSATVSSNSGATPSVLTLTMNDPSNAGIFLNINITVNSSGSNRATFNGSSSNSATLTGRATFNDNAYNSGTVSQTVTFTRSAFTGAPSTWRGTVNGSGVNTTFTANNPTFTLNGTDVWNVNSASMTFSSGQPSWIFNDQASNTATINGSYNGANSSFTFTGNSFTTNPVGTGVSNTNISFTSPTQVTFALTAASWTVSTFSWVFATKPLWTFSTSGGLNSGITIIGDAVFNSGTRNSGGTVVGNATFNGTGLNYSGTSVGDPGRVLGDATFTASAYDIARAWNLSTSDGAPFYIPNFIANNSSDNIFIPGTTSTRVASSTEQSKFGGSSGYFDGAAQVAIPYSPELDFGTGDFTVESWVYMLNNTNTAFFAGSSSSNAWVFSHNGGTSPPASVTFGRRGQTADINYTADGPLPLNQWVHVAVSRSGTTLRAFVNGAVVATVTNNSTAYTQNGGALYIGSRNNADYFNGYLDDFRIVKGSAVYTANFTPPTQPLAPITQTNVSTPVLLRFNNALVSKAVYPFEPAGAVLGATTFSSPTPVAFSIPASNNTRAIDTTNFIFSGGNPTLTVSDNASVTLRRLIFTGNVISNAASFNLGAYYQSGPVNATTAFNAFVINGDLTTNKPSGSDGIFSLMTGTINGNVVLNTPGNIGDHDSYTNGVDNAGRSKNIVINGNLTANHISSSGSIRIRGIRNFTKYVVNDSADNIVALSSAVTAVGDANSSTAQSKFGGASLFLPGTAGSYVSLPNDPALRFGTDAFTVEAWVYSTRATGSATGGTIISQSVIDEGAGNNTGWYMYLQNGHPRLFFQGQNGNQPVIAPTLANPIFNRWAHIALVRSGTNFTLYVDGVSVGSVTSAYNVNAAFDVRNDTPTLIGQHETQFGGSNFEGYLDDFRIVKGSAVYTANFTPPTQPLAPITQTNVSTPVLLRFNNALETQPSLTINGNVTFGGYSGASPYYSSAWNNSGFIDGRVKITGNVICPGAVYIGNPIGANNQSNDIPIQPEVIGAIQFTNSAGVTFYVSNWDSEHAPVYAKLNGLTPNTVKVPRFSKDWTFPTGVTPTMFLNGQLFGSFNGNVTVNADAPNAFLYGDVFGNYTAANGQLRNRKNYAAYPTSNTITGDVSINGPVVVMGAEPNSQPAKNSTQAGLPITINGNVTFSGGSDNFAFLTANLVMQPTKKVTFNSRSYNRLKGNITGTSDANIVYNGFTGDTSWYYNINEYFVKGAPFNRLVINLIVGSFPPELDPLIPRTAPWEGQPTVGQVIFSRGTAFATPYSLNAYREVYFLGNARNGGTIYLWNPDAACYFKPMEYGGANEVDLAAIGDIRPYDPYNNAFTIYLDCNGLPVTLKLSGADTTPAWTWSPFYSNSFGWAFSVVGRSNMFDTPDINFVLTDSSSFSTPYVWGSTHKASLTLNDLAFVSPGGNNFSSGWDSITLNDYSTVDMTSSFGFYCYKNPGVVINDSAFIYSNSGVNFYTSAEFNSNTFAGGMLNTPYSSSTSMFFSGYNSSKATFTLQAAAAMLSRSGLQPNTVITTDTNPPESAILFHRYGTGINGSSILGVI